MKFRGSIDCKKCSLIRKYDYIDAISTNLLISSVLTLGVKICSVSVPSLLVW